MQKPAAYEQDIKIALIRHTKSGGSGDGLIVSELPLMNFSTRVDLALIASSKLVAFEVKSARDSLTRLRRQADALENCFDEVNVVLEPKHLQGALSILPTALGVWTWSGQGFSIIRKARNKNP